MPLLRTLGLSRLFTSTGLILASLWLLCVQTPQSRASAPDGDAKHALHLTCTPPTGKIYPGDPVTVGGSVDGFTTDKDKQRLIFEWTGTPAITGTGDTATFVPATSGTTTIHGKVSLKSKPRRFGECDVPVTVAAFDPPTISCSANPSTIHAGDATTLSASANSPQNRPLTYAYSSIVGTISGSGNTATLTAGEHPALISVTCSVTDDQGHTASTETAVSVVANPMTSPPPPRVTLGHSPDRTPPSPPTISLGPRPPQRDHTPDLPQFPWPPPASSGRVSIPMTLGGPHLQSMGDVDKKILAALGTRGYVERAHYAVPNGSGFVILTRIEQIDKFGVAKPMPNRFSDHLPPPSGISSYLSALLTPNPGYFRIIAFVITNVPFNQSQFGLPEQQAIDMLQGPAALPPTFAGKPLPPQAEVTALIYEYKKSSSDPDAPAVPFIGDVPAQTHLENAGLWQLLVTP